MAHEVGNEHRKDHGELPDRRSFLGVLAGLIQGGIGLVLTVPIVRYVLHPALDSGSTDEKWTEVGELSELLVGEPGRRVVSIIESDGWSERVIERAVWVIRAPDDSVRVFTAVCPHLGCIVNWQTESKQFNCACHESYFDPAGAVLSGPSPRAMDTLEGKLEDGWLYIKYQRFQQLLPTQEVLS